MQILIFIFLNVFLILAFVYYFFRQKKFNEKYKLLWNWKNFYIKYIFLLLSFFILSIWIFWIKYWKTLTTSENKWIDMIFVLDVSKSMNVADLSQDFTRLDFAKESIWNFISKNVENRYWLVIFSWDAVSVSPLTDDIDIFLTFLEWVDYRNLTKQWTNFEKAFKLWLERFDISSSERSKALVFISDWGDTEDKIDSNILKSLQKKYPNIAYFIVGVWTKSGWKIITGQDFFWNLSYQKYNWKEVISKLNEENLEEISDIFKWEYFALSSKDSLENLAKNISNLEKKAILKSESNSKNDAWRILAFVSFLFFIIFFIITHYPYNPLK